MHVLNLLWLLILLCSLFSCQNRPVAPDPIFSLLGSWETEKNDVIIFDEDGFYKDPKYKQAGREGLVLMEEDSLGKFIEVDYGRLKYDILRQSGDSIVVDIIGENENKVFRRFKFICEENQCIRAVFKGSGLRDHLQFADVIHRVDDAVASAMKSTHLKFIIPEDFDQSQFYVAFEQEGEAIAHRNDSIRFEVPLSGLVETTFRNYLKSIVFGNVSFEMKKAEGGMRSIPSMSLKDWTDMMEKLKMRDEHTKQTKLLPYDLDEPIVLARARFNPSRDRVVNMVYGKTMQGNVLDFRFTTIRQELKILGYFDDFFLDL